MNMNETCAGLLASYEASNKYLLVVTQGWPKRTFVT